MSSDASPIIFKRKAKSKPGTARTTSLRSRDASPEAESGSISTPAAKQDDAPMKESVGETDMDGTAGGETGDDSPSILANRLKNKIKRARPKSRLSFGGDVDQDADTETFKIKKSSLSQKLSLGTHPASLPVPNVPAQTASTTGPLYDAAYLRELKASTPTARPPPARTAIDLEVDAYEADVSMMDIDAVAELDADATSTIIPSESSIKNAREKRGRLRSNKMEGVEEDFISLSVTKRDDVDKGPHPESRLMREEDEVGEGDDGELLFIERIALGKKSRKLEASKKREAMKEMIDDAEEEDEETIEWEQEQLRRGGHIPRADADKGKAKAVYKPAPIPQATQLPTLGPALERLSAQLSALTMSHAQNTNQLTTLSREREEVERRETELRDLVEKAEEKREWFGRFGSFVESVAGFLEEKYPLLEQLEKEELELYKEKAEKLRERRKADDEDDLSWFIGALPAPPVPTNEPETDEYGRAIPRPDPSAERRKRRAERVSRRQGRVLRRKAQEQSADVEEEGYSTDASLHPPLPYPSSIIPEADEILTDVRASSFRDPSRAGGIAEWWGEWRDRWADVYTGAWGGLGAVSVWEFWVRFESLGWEFLGRKDGSKRKKALEEFKWYRGLWTYSRPGAKKLKADKDGKGDDELLHADLPLGPDGDLVASMIGTAVIPLLCRRLEAGALDVFSTWQVKAVVDLVEQMEASLVEGGDEGMGKFFTLIRSISSLFEKAISEGQTLLDTYNSSAKTLGFDPESIPARQRYLARRIKLLQNLLIWRRYVSSLGGGSTSGAVVSAVVTRLVDDLLQGTILPISRGGWDIGGKEAAQKV
ncbi:hypothetical protein CVT24_013187 [Panaeolus cyanescens]|uniref:GCF C-terminal domain-containing protein n=1 Tax=Panaeolus cyanescens TaxID=181874 RepID=A0A409WAI0_9AGAR|nr:hypothetical protein CVT24_013187 [Panaeolus cyanescens]